ncbi:MAG: tyrosine-type recombinase/integrase [Vulcanimicrobiota bacterium]
MIQLAHATTAPHSPQDGLQPVLDFQGLTFEFLRRLDRSQETERTYRSALGLFGAWAAQQEATEDLAGLVLAYKQHRQATVAPATVAHDLAVLRRFFGWLVKTKRLAENPAEDIRPPKMPRGYRRDALTLTQAILLFAAVDPTTPAGRREMAILCLMVRAGLRDVELHRADFGNLGTVDGQRVLWVHGKGREQADEFVLLNRKTREALDAYLADRAPLEPGDPLIASLDGRGPGRLTTRQIRRIVTAALERVGFKSARVTAHSLRHTAATLAIQAGSSLSQVQAMMRHADPRTTSRYVHLHDRLENAAEKALDF